MMVNNSVFDVIQGLANRFYCDSKALPAQTDYTSLTTVLCFTALGVDLVIPIQELSEVHELPNYARLPGVQPWMMGVASIRGKFVPVVDLAGFVGGELSPRHKAQRLLVIDFTGSVVGLLVDSVAGVRQFDSEQFCDNPESTAGSLEPYIHGCFKEDDGSHKYLFRPSQLIEDQSFQNVAI